MIAVLRALGHSIADSVDSSDHLGVLSRGVLVVTELAIVIATGSDHDRAVVGLGHSSLGIGVGIKELLALIGRLLRHDSSRGVVGTHPGLTTVLTTVVTRLVGARHVVIAQVRALVGDLLASAILSTALGAIDGTLGVLGILSIGSLGGSIGGLLVLLGLLDGSSSSGSSLIGNLLQGGSVGHLGIVVGLGSSSLLLEVLLGALAAGIKGSLVGSSLGIPSSVRLIVSSLDLGILGVDGSLLGSSILVVLGLLGSDGGLGSLGRGSVIHILLIEVLLHGIVLGIELGRVGLELGTHGSSLGVVVIEDLLLLSSEVLARLLQGSSGILAILDGLGLGLVVSLQLGLHLLDAGLGGLGGITSLLGHLGLELLHLSLELLTSSLTLGSIGSSCLGLLHGVGGVGSSIGSGLLVGSSGGIAELLGSLLELGGLSSKGGLIGGELCLLLTSLLGLGISLGLGVGGVLDGGRISLEQEELLGASLWLGTTDSSSSTSGVGNGLAQSWTRIASGEAAIGARLLVHRHVIDHLLEAGIGALVNAVTEGVDHTVVGVGLGARIAVLRALGHSIADSVDSSDHLGVLSRGVLVVTELAIVIATGSDHDRAVVGLGHSSLGIG